MPDPTLEEVREALDWAKGEHFDECGMHEPGKCPVEVLARAVRAQAAMPVIAGTVEESGQILSCLHGSGAVRLCSRAKPDDHTPLSRNLYAGLKEGSQEPREETND